MEGKYGHADHIYLNIYENFTQSSLMNPQRSFSVTA